MTTSHSNVQRQQQESASDEQYITTFFCRALYDYQTQDSSSLSFQRDDVIEVLTRLESGWWDGLLGDERGWFPSNYVTVISDEEAEAALTGSEHSGRQMHPTESMAQSSNNTVTQSLSADWLNGDLGSDSRNGLIELANAALDQDSTPANDFWMPQVTPEGMVSTLLLPLDSSTQRNVQIFYKNTQTGQISRDLPMEADSDVSDSDLAGLTSGTSSRAGTSAGLGFVVGSASQLTAGFGLSSRTEIPEPWVRKLADDGMSYYFSNKMTGEVRWTAPEPDYSTVRQDRNGRSRAATKSSTTSSTFMTPNRLRSDSSVSGSGRDNSADRLSLYSNDSDAYVVERDRAGSLAYTRPPAANGRRAADWPPSSSREEDRALVELTAAERSARSLQQILSPLPPDSVADLSAQAKERIIAVIQTVRTIDFAHLITEDRSLDELVYGVVFAIRNLLYVSAAPSGHIPSAVIPGPRNIRDRRDTTASQTLLKPVQRKVTATLSKLVLSARAVQYNSGSNVNDTPLRIEGDAEELDRAVEAFVLEVERSHNQQIHSPTELKRLHGIFLTMNIGLGLVGAGAAGSWKGHGWVSLGEADEAPAKILGTEVVKDTRSYVNQVQELFSNFATNIRKLATDSGEPHFLRFNEQRCLCDSFASQSTCRMSIAYFTVIIFVGVCF